MGFRADMIAKGFELRMRQEAVTFMLGADVYRRGPVEVWVVGAPLEWVKGCATYYAIPGCTIAMLKVDPAERRKGLGRAAFHDVSEALKATGVKRITLEPCPLRDKSPVTGRPKGKPAVDRETLIRLYETEGFKVVPESGGHLMEWNPTEGETA